MGLGVGVIGCGRWGQNYIRVFHELPAARVIGACDVDPRRLSLISQRYPDVPTFTDLAQLLEQKELDALVVALPVSVQGEVVRTALLRRKHVLAEKPFVVDPREGLELVKLARRVKAALMVGYIFLYNPAVRKLKEHLRDPRQGIGDLYYLYATRTALGPVRNDVNVAWDLAAHDIAIFSYLLETRPESVNAVGSKFLRNSREDVVFATLNYPNQVIGHIHVSWADPNRVRQVVVVGSRQRILYDDLNIQEQLRIFEKSVYSSGKDTDSFGEFILAIRDGDILSPKIEVSEPLKNQCEHFLESIQNGASPLTDGPFALDVLSVLGALQRSLNGNGAAAKVSYEYSLY
ncbi:MAG: Gfo/Idh/MocA family oxidoreductase [Deltaproteobacteria bacterium]|nr:Gfo/Idh/MocA family oxidoreductase [Deltaproteobacteria bacterium]